MPINFTQLFSKRILLLGFSILYMLSASAQTDSLAKPHADSSHKTAVRPKEISKLEDVNIPPEMFAKIKMMGPNQLVAFREDFTYNIKAEDNIEYSITVKLGFSQDMITGIIRWVPLYSSNDAPPEITQIKIPVKFCCTTKIDTVHKKQHCGKMSELNDLEDYEHCKEWIQAADASKNDKPVVINKKGKGVNKSDSTESFGKAAKPLTKKEQKERAKKGFKDDDSDSTGVAKDSSANYGKPEKPSKKDLKKKKGKEEEPNNATDSSATPAPVVKEKKGKTKEEIIKPKKQESEYGKPAPMPKESKKKKSKEKDKPEPTDSTNYRPEPPMKDEEVRKDSTEKKKE